MRCLSVPGSRPRELDSGSTDPVTYRLSGVGSHIDDVRVFAGVGCAAVCVSYQASSQGGSVFLPGVAPGDSFLVQCGLRHGSDTGTLRIEQDEPCPNVAGDLVEDNDTFATALALAPGSYSGPTVTKADHDFYLLTVPPRSTLKWRGTQNQFNVLYRSSDLNGQVTN